MKIENLEARRALFAFKAAEKGNDEQQKNKKFNYSAAVQELPTMLRINGLRATMAYFYSKESGQYMMVFENVRDWFKCDDEPTQFMRTKFEQQKNKKPEAVFMEILIDLTDSEYRIVQAETLTLANWLIRFIKTENSNSNENRESQA